MKEKLKEKIILASIAEDYYLDSDVILCDLFVINKIIQGTLLPLALLYI